jgi:hypothetical protein
MKTFEEIRQNIANRKEPLSAAEHLEILKLVRTYGLEEYLKFACSFEHRFYWDIFALNLTPEIKREIINGRVKEYIDFIDADSKRMGGKPLTDDVKQEINKKFGIESSVRFIKNSYF